MSSWNANNESLQDQQSFTYLSVCVDNGAQKLPGAASAVHPHHPQNLEEAQASEGARRHSGAHPQDDQRGDDGNYVCKHSVLKRPDTGLVVTA